MARSRRRRSSRTIKAPRKVDPITLATIGAIAGIVGGCAAAVEFLQKRLPQSPIKGFRKLEKHLAVLSDELGYLGKDVDILEEIFVGADYRGEDRTVRMDNGAYLTVAELMRLERVSDATMGRLRRINKTTLKIERIATFLAPQGVEIPVRHMSPAMEKLDRILRSRDLTVDVAWRDMRSAIDDLNAAVAKLREQISKG